MKLIVDIGNTFIKMAFFYQDEIVKKEIFTSIDDFLNFYSNAKYEKCIISSVRKLEDFNLKTNTILFDHELNIPIKNEYKTPKTLGLDRLAAVVGASSLYPNQDVLVIDAGSCITFDYLTKDKTYKGGAISLGLNMKLKALNNFTSKLPLVQLVEMNELIGTSTETSILSGVINGTIAEISGIIQEYQNISDNLAPVLCGGDAHFISNKLELSVKVDENLVLYGLNEVLKFNE